MDAPPLWSGLRAATRADHERAEAALDPLTRPATLAGYAALLRVLRGFQAPAERLLDAGAAPPDLDRPGRRALADLDADLAELGAAEPPAPAAAGLPEPADPARWWGLLYVVEGAALGRRVLHRRVTARLGPVPARFLAGRGAVTGPRWRRLGALADRYVHGPAAAAAARDAARAAFAAFTTHATRAGSAGGQRARSPWRSQQQ